MTTLAVELSSTLQATLGQQGVWTYAVHFDGGSASWTSLVDNGAVQGSASIALPDQWNGGKVYFLVQSQDASQPSDLETLISQESDINWENAESYGFRYDSFEVTLLDQTGDVGNLTSVEGFGLPMALEVSYTDGTDSRGYKVGGSTLFADFDAIDTSKTFTYKYADGPLQGAYRAAISPSQAVGLDPQSPAFQATDWEGYVDALKSESGIAISGFFNGAPDANGIWHNAGFYSYALEWNATDEVFWLSPQDNSEIEGYIRFTPDGLQNSIYSTLGDVEIYTDKSTPYTIIDHDSASMSSGENNQWGGILTQFLTGLTAGYYGREGTPENARISGTIDLDTNWNWDPDYAFGRNVSGTAPGYQSFDPYSEIFYFNSNSYGSGYSDNVMGNYAEGGPLISVYDTATGRNVDDITITLFDDGETPEGYIEPVIYNYIDPGDDGFQTPEWTGNGANIVLNFFNKDTILDGSTGITLEIADGSDDPGEISWSPVTFSPSGDDTLWQSWTIAYESGAYTATAAGTSGQAGSMIVSNVPTAESGVSWYRLTVGSGDAAKTFNLYTETQGYAFVNPAVSGQEGALAIDGLALVALPALTTDTISTFSLDFLYGGTTSLHPDTLTRNTDQALIDSMTQPDAPVAGTLSGDTFTALSGQESQVSNTISTTSSQLTFGWTGLNSASGTASWISGYTNKIGALNAVRLEIEKNGSSLDPITAYADIDGQWQTEAQAFADGTYTITATEYAASDTSFATPTGRASAAVTVTVDAPELALARAGSALALEDDGIDATTGSWIRLETTDTDADSGTTLLVYATDEAGERVGRDGETGITVEDATVGTIGAVTGDDGLDLLSGGQSIHLLAGQHLRFAVLSGNGVLDADPDMRIVSQDDGTMTVEVGGFELTATVDNTLDESEALATAQRQYNEALTYLERGETVDVRVTGHCANENTLGFVRFDIGPDGGWSVDGVAYGDTDAFESAVRASLDDAFTFTGGGRFDETLTWTVDGADGYYAPVLLTETGETFVIGDANPGGHAYLRLFGESTFGFEDVTSDDGADFDYNDLVVKLTPSETALAL